MAQSAVGDRTTTRSLLADLVAADDKGEFFKNLSMEEKSALLMELLELVLALTDEGKDSPPADNGWVPGSNGSGNTSQPAPKQPNQLPPNQAPASQPSPTEPKPAEPAPTEPAPTSTPPMGYPPTKAKKVRGEVIECYKDDGTLDTERHRIEKYADGAIVWTKPDGSMYMIASDGSQWSSDGKSGNWQKHEGPGIPTMPYMEGEGANRRVTYYEQDDNGNWVKKSKAFQAYQA